MPGVSRTDPVRHPFPLTAVSGAPDTPPTRGPGRTALVRLGWGGRLGSRQGHGAGHGRIAPEPRKANSYQLSRKANSYQLMLTRLFVLSLLVLAVSACVTPSPSFSAEPMQSAPAITEEYARKALICNWTGKWSTFGNSMALDVKEIKTDNSVLGSYSWGTITNSSTRWETSAGSVNFTTGRSIKFVPPNKIVRTFATSKAMWFELQPDGRLIANLRLPAGDWPAIDTAVLTCNK